MNRRSAESRRTFRKIAKYIVLFLFFSPMYHWFVVCIYIYNIFYRVIVFNISLQSIIPVRACKSPSGLPPCAVCYGLSTHCLHSSGFNTLSVMFSFFFFSSPPSSLSSVTGSPCKRYSDQNSVVSEEVITKLMLQIRHKMKINISTSCCNIKDNLH